MPFSPAMVRALLREVEAPGTGKTETRRLFPIPVEELDHLGEPWVRCNGHMGPKDYLMGEIAGEFWARWRTGDRIWVREAWKTGAVWNDKKPSEVPSWARIQYLADGVVWLNGEAAGPETLSGKYRHARFMPAWMSRLTLKVTNVRVQRLHDITEAEALREGIVGQRVIVGANCNCGRHAEEYADRFYFEGCDEEGYETAVDAYAGLWEAIRGAWSWKRNPWIAAVTFSVHEGNKDDC